MDTEYKPAQVAPRRVLLAMLVYNGDTFVPRAIESMARLQGMPGETGPCGKLRSHIVDALVLDDASPAPGWSDALAEQCQQLQEIGRASCRERVSSKV